jgi:Legume lectin domain
VWVTAIHRAEAARALQTASLLDLHNNQGEGSNSVRLEVNGVTTPAGAVDLTPSGIDLHNGHTYHVSIGGGNGNNTYSFEIFDLQNGPNGYVFFEQAFFLPTPQLNFGMGYVGFTASTGATTSSVKILDWTVIDQTGEPPVVTYPRPNYPNGFAGSTGLFYRSGAGVSGNALQLTNGNKYTSFSASTTAQVMPQGIAFYQAFSTDFDFIVDGGVGDGFAFVLQNDSLGALGSSGGGLGYGLPTPGGTGPSITNSLAIKFDLHNNAGEGTNSTGLYLNGASPTVPAIDLSTSGIQLYSGHPFHAQITSDGTTLTLSLTDLVQYRVFTKVLYSGPDLATMIPAQAYAGFTAGTGSTASSIRILNWTWNTN